MKRVQSIVLALCAVGSVAGPAAGAEAQRPLRQVLDLNRQGMDQYMQLELEQAQATLERALQTAQRGHVTGAPLARTYLNLGVIAVGGFGDNGAGMNYFTQALQTDGSIQLDPLTSTPEIQTVFNLARQRAGTGENTGSHPGGGTGGNTGGGTGAGSGSGASGDLQHQPVPEQLAQTAVPIYIEVGGDPAHVYAFYRAHGMAEYRRVEMRAMSGGYGYEIPCSDVFQPAVEYYVVAFADDGSPIGFAGSQREPFSVNIVSSRTQPAPALPGMQPPETCRDEECPPGMDGCGGGGGGGGMGATCRDDGECSSGLSCEDNFCVFGGESGGGDDDGFSNDSDSDSDGAPIFYLQAGGALGLGFASAGMQADRFGDSPALVPDTDPECGVRSGFYCVRVAQGGIVAHGGIRVQANVYFLDFLGVGVWARFAPTVGDGDLAFLNLGARANFVVADVLLGDDPSGAGLQATLFLGGGFGQIQIQPPGNPGVDLPGDSPGTGDAPYIISGLGNISAGGQVVFRFVRNFGAFFQADFMFQVPTFLFNIDLTLGLSVQF